MQSRNEITDTLNARLLASVSLRTYLLSSASLSNYFIPDIRFSGMLRLVGSKLLLTFRNKISVASSSFKQSKLNSS